MLFYVLLSAGVILFVIGAFFSLKGSSSRASREKDPTASDLQFLNITEDKARTERELADSRIALQNAEIKLKDSRNELEQARAELESLKQIAQKEVLPADTGEVPGEADDGISEEYAKKDTGEDTGDILKQLHALKAELDDMKSIIASRMGGTEENSGEEISGQNKDKKESENLKSFLSLVDKDTPAPDEGPEPPAENAADGTEEDS